MAINQGAGAAAQPSRTTYGGTFSGSGYGTGPYYGNFQGSSTTTNPAEQTLAQSAIIADSHAQGAMLNAQTNQKLGALQTILRTTTVQPGQMYGGVVEIARPPASSIMHVSVTFAGERHTFSF